ncbi:DUF602-domain-containing protein [Cutaneotrichosporon oleaginosum]|uniref:DUF602-domain-containing protein n=1 Tax=Cutaneotrichosporon oleaginosum TaxID=879819 RepID=A0A0J0XFC8_9TREE|nr:DUF602-domain-containing protein [Cutaneotrichosporon oleaginosum]KLT39795.1 DUF602-domain-containing protein [Cutaneotrichosporon oleaginosum]TXT10320.1 hypothetical protein COLE_04254 [Cutaneotrichosporon oleaginosum]
MGADGGSIPDRRDLVKTRGKAAVADKAVARERFFNCALSRKRLAKPVVADPLGKLYNKDAMIEYLLDKSAYGDGEQICPYILGVKDLLTLNAQPNPDEGEGKAPFVCWLSLKEMNGAVPFIALRHCGCVFADGALRAVLPNLAKVGDEAVGPTEEASCPNCTKPFHPTSAASVLPIYPSQDVQEVLLATLFATRAAAKANKKRKKEGKEKDGKEKDGKEEKGERASKVAKLKTEASSRSASGSPAPVSNASLAPSVRAQLAEHEKRRQAAKAGMSDAVKAMFHKNDGAKKGDVADFFGRTFNRYATN